MATVLSCWKDIASHLGKGVRTVQRWERDLGLPVRRPNKNNRQIVLAISEELDQWVLNQQRSASDKPITTHLGAVRTRELACRLAKRAHEVHELTAQLMRHQGAKPHAQSFGSEDDKQLASSQPRRNIRHR